jgi:hypothetical protein
MALDFNTIHIFGYGETQLIKKNVNIKCPTSELTSVGGVISNVYSKKPSDSDASAEYHAVNLFHNMFADYQPKTGKGFRVKWAELDATLIEALVEELVGKIPTTEVATDKKK